MHGSSGAHRNFWLPNFRFGTWNFFPCSSEKWTDSCEPPANSVCKLENTIHGRTELSSLEDAAKSVICIDTKLKLFLSDSLHTNVGNISFVSNCISAKCKLICEEQWGTMIVLHLLFNSNHMNWIGYLWRARVLVRVPPQSWCPKTAWMPQVI